MYEIYKDSKNCCVCAICKIEFLWKSNMIFSLFKVPKILVEFYLLPLQIWKSAEIGRNCPKWVEQVIYMSKTDTKPIVSKYLLLILPTSQHLSRFSSSYFEFLLLCLIHLSNGQIWYFAVWSKYPSITVYAVWVKIACPN